MTTPARQVLDRTMTEAQLQEAVIEIAHAFKWMVAHFRPAKTEQGWRTAVSADGAGLPDLILVRGLRLIFAELKSQKGRIAPAQREWLDRLTAVPGVEVYLWRPSLWSEGKIEEALR
jgi:hypothetical protein